MLQNLRREIVPEAAYINVAPMTTSSKRTAVSGTQLGEKALLQVSAVASGYSRSMLSHLLSLDRGF